MGLRLAQFTVAYNVVEGAVAITVGLMAGLVSLVGFGLDSGIESAASVLVGLRLAARLRGTRICVLLSISTLIGLGADALTGAVWLDPVAGFVIALFAIHEGREAWEGELVEDDDDDD